MTLDGVQNRECQPTRLVAGSRSQACRMEIESRRADARAGFAARRRRRRFRACASCPRVARAHRRAEDAHPHVRRLRDERRLGLDVRARRAGGCRAHEPLCAEAGQSVVRHRRRPRAGESVRRSSGALRRTRGAGRQRARHAVHGDRRRPGALRADRIGALRLLPARRRVRSARSRRQVASRFASTCARGGAFVQLAAAADAEHVGRRRIAPARGRRGRRSWPRSARRCCSRRCRCASRRFRCRVPSAARCSS